MTVPYNLLPIETHLAMITAQQASVPVLQDAARMWTEVRQWVETARTELNKKVSTLSPQWTDDAGRAMTEKLQRTQAELNAWAEQIDGSNVVSNLTTLAGAIPEAQAEVSGLYQSYLAAISNPFTAPAALAIQQASGARMTALGGQFDTSMLTMCAATGVKSPADLVPGLDSSSGSTPSVSASDVTKTMDDATSALSALQGLDSAITGGGGAAGADLSGLTGNLPTTDGSGSLPDLSGLASSGAGPSLAGLTPTLPTGGLTMGGGLPGGFSGLSGLSGSGVPPVPTGLSALPVGALGGAGGLPMAMRPAASRQTGGTAEEVQPGYAGPVGGMPMSGAGMGAGAGGRPGPGVQAPAGAGRGRRAAAEQDGVLAALRGRAGTGESTGFTLARPRADAGLGAAAQPLDEELWRVE